MLYEKEVSFRYKGNRDYVHGTDIFDNILEISSYFFKVFPTRIKGSFHRLLRNNGILRIYNESEKIDFEKSYANYSMEINGHMYQQILLRNNSEISSSYEYDEKIVLDNMVNEKMVAKMVVKPTFTYIEQMVAMTKELHLMLFPDAGNRWLFTKIDLKDVIDPSLYPGHELAIKVIKNFHNKLTQSAVLLDNKLLGNVWFSQAS